MGIVRARVRVGADTDDSYTFTMDERDAAITSRQAPIKEFCLIDDVLNVSDTFTFTIANVDGESSGKIVIGQRLELDLSDSDVAGGTWVRSFTGRVTRIGNYSDQMGGNNIMVTAMDLGWHLVNCHSKPFTNLEGITWSRLLDKLIDSSWGFGQVVGDNSLNRRLKQGRVGIQRALTGLQATLTSILPYIQVEPGQAPWEILQLYAQREGVLINVSAQGDLVFFRPDYKQDPSYELHYRDISESAKNNIVGRPSLEQTIEGYYSDVQCFSTIVNPQKIANPEDPNASYTNSTFTPSSNPLPFTRHHVISDGESITKQLRLNRATWEWQKGLFDSWNYEADFRGFSQNGRFFASDTLISMDDQINGVSDGAYYVQRVQRSATIGDGLRTHLTIKRPGLLNPALTTFDLGSSTKKPAAVPTPRK